MSKLEKEVKRLKSKPKDFTYDELKKDVGPHSAQTKVR